MKNKFIKLLLFFLLLIPYLLLGYIFFKDLIDKSSILFFIIYIVLWFIYFIIDMTIKYVTNKPIELNSFFSIALKLTILHNTFSDIRLSQLFLLKQQLSLVISMTKLGRTKIYILNLLLYISVIISLFLLYFFDDNIVFTIIVIIFGTLVLLCILMNVGNFAKITKENLDGIKKDIGEKNYRKAVILSIVSVILIFAVPILIIVLYDYITNDDKNYTIPIKEEINVQDNNLTIDELTDEDKEYIENEIEKELGGEVDYYIANIKGNQTNEQKERYNEIVVIANIKSDSLDKNAITFIFKQYLTSSKLHKEREIELYSYFESTQITKGDWINKTKETS